MIFLKDSLILGIFLLMTSLNVCAGEPECFATDPEPYLRFATRTHYNFEYNPITDPNEDVQGKIYFTYERDS